ncbi:hypothetical protein BLNAU_23478 [Blattamonas nauphoetae]|uniref:Uncharacterized protein n=1 Tax=Blattamonas nauphoetae TaxID=2049346 RepID=A0ABQ9WQ33_9EUKA|nr:hypothetical protein BLNAU_23478 [Blattamonas nauphoetae]
MGKRLGCKGNRHNKRERAAKEIRVQKDAPKVLARYEERASELKESIREQSLQRQRQKKHRKQREKRRQQREQEAQSSGQPGDNADQSAMLLDEAKSLTANG